MLVVVALGGNALLRRGEPLTAEAQARNVAEAADFLADIASEHDLVVTHGNGPQVGLLALQSALVPDGDPFPLDVIGAESEGMVGYLLSRELRGRLPGREVATLLTQVVVDPKDPAFEAPTKPIGPIYEAARARRLADELGWSIVPASTGGFRRVVASPEPAEIIELEVVRMLVASGVVVTCAGGGGIPVARTDSGRLTGVEAVVDKDFATAKVATALSADLLMLLTDQPGVFPEWPNKASGVLRAASVDSLRKHDFERGTMAPKVEAACRFVEATGGEAAIGELRDAREILEGRSGTHVTPGRLVADSEECQRQGRA